MQEMQERAVTHILSYGGGVNSAALMIQLTQAGEPLDEVVFADTGGEVPETYEYLDVARQYLAKYGIPLRIIPKRIRGRDLYDTSWHRRVFPSAIWRWSTRDFKVAPIHRYYRSLDAHVNQYLAIAYDEIERMKDSAVSYITNVYPLVDNKVTREKCILLITEAGLPVPVKSGCFFCPFNSMDRWRWLYETHPDLYQKAMALEENSKHFPSQRLTDQVFRERAKITLRELPLIFESRRLLATQAHEAPCGAECMT